MTRGSRKSLLYVSASLLAMSIAAPIPSVFAQTTATLPSGAAPVIAYDVMSIRVNKGTDSRNVGYGGTNTRFTATNVSLKTLLAKIYSIKPDLIYGLPGPIDSARFDIEATISNPDLEAIDKMTPEQSRQKLLPLLTERFDLKVHTESKVLPVYELVVAPSGPKFSPSSTDDSTSPGRGPSIRGSNRHYTVTAQLVSMGVLAGIVGDQLHRTVIDKTGLTAKYNFVLHFFNSDNAAADPGSDPTIFTALTQQLGLKLQSAKGPVETLVVDHVDMPSEN